MNSLQKLFLFGFLNQLASLSCIEAHRCFVCVPSVKKKDHDIINLIKEFASEKIRKCEEFNEFERESFIKECPEDSIGCLTQLQGNSFLRSCARYGWDICREANNVTYCYCSRNECNTPESRLGNFSSYIEPYIDDEDSFEYSGDSTFVDSEDDYEQLEEDVTEFPTSIMPNINEPGSDEEVLQTTNSNKDIVLTDDFDIEDDENRVISINEVDAEKPSDASSSLTSSITFISVTWIIIVRELLIY